MHFWIFGFRPDDIGNISHIMIVITAFFLNVWANHTETFFLQA